MIVENKFLYTRVLEGNGRVEKEFTFAGAMLMVLAIVVVLIAAALVVYPWLASIGAL